MDITIDKKRVLDVVKMNVSIVGRSYKDSNGNSLWDVVSIEERDVAALEQLWNSPFGLLLASLENFISGCEGKTITFADNRRFNEAVVSDLKEVIENYLGNSITAEWMKLKAVEYAPTYTSAAEKDLESILVKLRVKTEPVLKTFNS